MKKRFAQIAWIGGVQMTLKVVIEYLSPHSGPGASKIKIKCGEPGKLRGYSLNLSRLIGLFNLLDEKNKNLLRMRLLENQNLLVTCR